MTQDEIIEMAVKAGIAQVVAEANIEIMEAFTKLVAAKHDPKIAIADAYRAGVDSGIAAEREACAKVCDKLDAEVDKYPAQCAQAIRARNND